MFIKRPYNSKSYNPDILTTAKVMVLIYDVACFIFFLKMTISRGYPSKLIACIVMLLNLLIASGLHRVFKGYIPFNQEHGSTRFGLGPGIFFITAAFAFPAVDLYTKPQLWLMIVPALPLSLVFAIALFYRNQGISKANKRDWGVGLLFSIVLAYGFILGCRVWPV